MLIAMGAGAGVPFGALAKAVSQAGRGKTPKRPVDLPESANELFEALETLAEEMEEAKGYLTGVFPVRLETNAGVAGQLLTAELYGLGLDYIERYPNIVRGVTRDQAHEAARKYLSTKAYALVTAGPAEDGAVAG